MKRIITLLFLLLVIIPIGVLAKTPNQGEVIKVINSIQNVQVDDDIIINSSTITTSQIQLEILKNGNNISETIPYILKEKELEFTGGYALINTKTGTIIDDIKENENAFYIYSLLESKSLVPYKESDYYNNKKIKEIIESSQNLQLYKDQSNTFGISFKEEVINDTTKKVFITYHYYFDGDYAIINMDNNKENSINPSTGSYNKQVTIMLIIIIAIGLYTYLDSIKRERKGI